jgi:hypothetical protein
MHEYSEDSTGVCADLTVAGNKVCREPDLGGGETPVGSSHPAAPVSDPWLAIGSDV